MTHENVAFSGAVGQVAKKIKNRYIETAKPESQLQDEFYKRTQIWAPKSFRLWLEYLLESGRFSIPELRDALKDDTIWWDVDQQRPRVDTSTIKLGIKYVYTGVFLLMVGITFSFFTQPESSVFVLWLLMAAGVLLGWNLRNIRALSRRRRVAMRIRDLELADQDRQEKKQPDESDRLIGSAAVIAD